MGLNTVLDVGSDTLADIGKESFTSMLADIAVDTGASLIPGLSGVIVGYKRTRFERNIKIFAEELFKRLDEVQRNMKDKTDEQKEQIDKVLGYVIDYVIDEQQEQKIQLIVNGLFT